MTDPVAVRIIARGPGDTGTVYRGASVMPGDEIEVAAEDVGAFLASGWGELVNPPAPEPGQLYSVPRRMAAGRGRLW
jgi:hypothetical protein